MTYALGVPRLVVNLRSEPDRITVRWLEWGELKDFGRALVLDYAGRRVDTGPEPRLELPPGHPHRDEHLYEPSSAFLYVDLFVVHEDGMTRVKNEYGMEDSRQGGRVGPPRTWGDFMTALGDELRHREQTPD
jgi:hypothetical protein